MSWLQINSSALLTYSCLSMNTPLSAVRISLDQSVQSSLRIFDSCRVMLGLGMYFIEESQCWPLIPLQILGGSFRHTSTTTTYSFWGLLRTTANLGPQTSSNLCAPARGLLDRLMTYFYFMLSLSLLPLLLLLPHMLLLL